MCELFGMSASRPAIASEPLSRLRLRGGQEADNPDGWGVAWWDGDVFHLVKEPLPACHSETFGALTKTTHSRLIVAHVRKARHPPINTLNNTHPFPGACCGKEWVFAHNGLVPEVVEMEQQNIHAVCSPKGETDSEFAFCHLLSYLAQDFYAPVASEFLMASLAAASEQIAAHGKFNFLMSDGDYLIAYGHDRLHYLEQSGEIDIAMIATEPLTDQAHWISFEPGELRIYRNGKLAGRVVTQPQQVAIPATGT
ncbi:MAG: class II glutamine amidotransferase [Sulfuricellaceae bacterium]|nr:class II glutamine amidotransferase [Sulfuricellaceae bacterium]